tara:strand:- start:1613 stop:2149 length:537 start_codon:yes stop_codon:yes gene_type:complete
MSKKVEIILTVRMMKDVALEIEADSPMEAMNKVDEVIRRGQVDFILSEKAYIASWNNIKRVSGVSEGINAYEMEVIRDQNGRFSGEHHRESKLQWTASDTGFYSNTRECKRDDQISPMENFGIKSKGDLVKQFEVRDKQWTPKNKTTETNLRCAYASRTNQADLEILLNQGVRKEVQL